MSLSQRFADQITLEYSLIDRMRVRGHVLNLQTITMLRTYFQRIHGVEWIEPKHLQLLTDQFVAFVEQYASTHDIPILSAKPGEKHVEQAAAHLDRVADQQRAVYCIVKVQEEVSSFVSYVPKQGESRERLHLVLAAVLQFAHLITGFRNAELRSYLQGRFGLSPDEYTAAQLRYDLLKLRAKGWIHKLDGQTRYVLTPKGVTQATALAKLNECLNGILGSPPGGDVRVSSPQPELQKQYRKVRASLAKLCESLGIGA